jgi:hypothetical protein
MESCNKDLCLFKVFCCLSGNPVTQGRDPLRIQHSCKSYQRPFVRYLSKEPTTPNLFFLYTRFWCLGQPAAAKYGTWPLEVRNSNPRRTRFHPARSLATPRVFFSPPRRHLSLSLSRSLSLRTLTNNGSSSSSIIPISYVLFSHFLAFNAPWLFRSSKCFTSLFTLFLSSLSDGSSCSLCHGFYIYTFFPKFSFANGHFLFECPFCFSSSFGDLRFCERVEWELDGSQRSRDYFFLELSLSEMILSDSCGMSVFVQDLFT